MPARVQGWDNRMSGEEDWRRRSVCFAGDGVREEVVCSRAGCETRGLDWMRGGGCKDLQLLGLLLCPLWPEVSWGMPSGVEGYI